MDWRTYFGLSMPLVTGAFLMWLFRRDWYHPKGDKRRQA